MTNILKSNLPLLHDLFNLFSLSFIIYLITINWNIQFTDYYYFPILTYNGLYFFYLWKSTLIYFVFDLLWLILKPESVKSPKIIIFHHLVTLLSIMVPFYRYYQCGKLMSICLTVEINTILLTSKRLLGIYNDYFKYKKIFNIIQSFISLNFYLSWIIIRLIMFPIITLEVYKFWNQEYLETKYFTNIYSYPLISQTFLCLLNYKWTFDLLIIKLKNKNKSIKYL